MFDGRTRLASQVADEVRTHFPDQTFRAAVPPRSGSPGPSHGQTVATYPNSRWRALLPGSRKRDGRPRCPWREGAVRREATRPGTWSGCALIPCQPGHGPTDRRLLPGLPRRGRPDRESPSGAGPDQRQERLRAGRALPKPSPLAIRPIRPHPLQVAPTLPPCLATFRELPLDAIRGPRQPRTVFDDGTTWAVGASIRDRCPPADCGAPAGRRGCRGRRRSRAHHGRAALARLSSGEQAKPSSHRQGHRGRRPAPGRPPREPSPQPTQRLGGGSGSASGFARRLRLHPRRVGHPDRTLPPAGLNTLRLLQAPRRRSPDASPPESSAGHAVRCSLCLMPTQWTGWPTGSSPRVSVRSTGGRRPRRRPGQTSPPAPRAGTRRPQLDDLAGSCRTTSRRGAHLPGQRRGKAIDFASVEGPHRITDAMGLKKHRD